MTYGSERSGIALMKGIVRTQLKSPQTLGMIDDTALTANVILMFDPFALAYHLVSAHSAGIGGGIWRRLSR